MSRKGNCWDNAPTESFFNSLKKSAKNRSSGPHGGVRQEFAWRDDKLTVSRMEFFSIET